MSTPYHLSLFLILCRLIIIPFGIILPASSASEHILMSHYLNSYCVIIILKMAWYLVFSRNMKKAEDNVKSLHNEIEENSTNIQKLEVGYVLYV